jgi:ribonucleoside-diphosphate reductase alpha chain
LAIAPTASIATLAGGVSPSIEPQFSNFYMHKTKNGFFLIKNHYLQELFDEKQISKEEQKELWSQISHADGSVQSVDEKYLTVQEKNIFQTSFEIQQKTIIDLASDRVPYLCQGQSLNLFFRSNVSKQILNQTHISAWKQGCKGLYYLRSQVSSKAESLEGSRDFLKKIQESAALSAAAIIEEVNDAQLNLDLIEDAALMIKDNFVCPDDVCISCT